MRKLWNMRWFRVLFGVVLTAALLAPVVLPALQMQQKEPENPIRKENIQPVRRLSFGDGDGGTLAAAPLSHEDSSGGGKSEQEQQPEQQPEENTDETPEKSPEQPQPTPEPQPGQAGSEQPGEETGGQTDDAGDEAQPDALDLGLVLSWYRYGGERYRSICPADTTVRQDVRTAQLPDGYLRYELDLRGLDAVDTQITGVQLSENNGAYEPADVRGSIEMQVGPQGEDSYYTLRVQAVCTHVLEDGARQEQETEFCFVLVYSDELDLEAQLLWMLADGGTASLRCQPGSRAACTVRNDELEENLLRYSFRLGGQSAEDAKLLSIAYSAANGQSGVLAANGGALTLQSGADGVWPRWRFPPASFQGSAPLHIKAAALTRCVAAHSYLRCFCISSTLGFFVTFTVRIIATARCTPFVGDLERVPALFIFVQVFFGGTSVMYLHLQPQKGTSS